MSIQDPNSLNEIIHGRVRLRILTVLANVQAIDFVALRDQLKISDGSLSVAVKKLEEAKLVKMNKTLDMGRTRSTIRLTAQGQREFEVYLSEIRSIIDAAAGGSAMKKTAGK